MNDDYRYMCDSCGMVYPKEHTASDADKSCTKCPNGKLVTVENRPTHILLAELQKRVEALEKKLKSMT